MAKRARAIVVDPLDPDVRDEAVAIQPGETRYTIDLDEATVESLREGICPESLSQRMHDLLSWRREQYRVDARNRRDVGKGHTA